MNIKKLFLYLLIVSVSISALVGIGVIILGNFGDLETRVLLTALTVTGTSILGLACGAYLESGRGRILPFCGIGFALVSAVMWLYLVWHDTVHDDLFVKLLLSSTVLAAGSSLLSLISLARLDRRFFWFPYSAHAAVWLLTAYLVYLIWFPDSIDENITPRIIGVLSIVVAAITLVTPILHKLSSGEPETESIDAEIGKLKARIAELEVKKAEVAGTQDLAAGTD
jgi:hypothetical protein